MIRRVVSVAVAMALLLAGLVVGAGSASAATIPAGDVWVDRASNYYSYTSVVWGGPAGQEKFVSVAWDGVFANKVMTSPDGVTWTDQTGPAEIELTAVTWGGPAGQEKFVAVSSTTNFTGNRVMTSPDGVTWTMQTSPFENEWRSVTWGGPAGQEKFVAVSSASDNTSDRVMTSPDGVTWTLQTSAFEDEWRSVAWGGPAGQEKFVAVASSGSGDRVMTSPDGVTWTSRTSASNNDWRTVAWGGAAGQEKFVAVASSGSGDRVMTSPDGVTWTSRTSPSDDDWWSVAWGGAAGQERFVAVSAGVAGDNKPSRVMTSPDGVTWTLQTGEYVNEYVSVTWGGPAGQEKFVAVARDGPTDFRVMTSGESASVTYSGNGAGSGSAPSGTPSFYNVGTAATVAANTGSFAKTGFGFAGWNTAADGSGTTYQPAATFSISENTVLYARWLAPPTVTGVSPSGGPLAGSTPITITGTGLDASGLSVTVGGAACTNVQVVSATQITCDTPAGTIGAANVVVTTDGGSDTETGGFTYFGVPAISSVAPPSGSQLGGERITISGSNLQGVTVTIDGSICNSVSVSPAGTELSCTTPAGTVGAKNVVVTSPGGSDTETGGFIYTSAPTVASVSPSTGSNAGGTPITITGTQFAAGATVTVGGAACTSLTVVSDTEITCTTPAGSNGARDVVVTNIDTGTVTSTGGFTYVSAPTIGSVAPSAGLATGGTPITITGTQFAAGATVTVGGATCTSITVVSATQITCTTPAGSVGAADVVVTNTDTGEVTSAGAFTYNQSAPTIGSVSPAAGPDAGSTPITITGTQFGPGATVTVGGAACTSVEVVSLTTIMCTTPAGSVGSADVEVTNTDTGTVTSTGGFTYVSSPTVASIAPDSGSNAGGTSITISGTQFAAGATVTVGGAACTSITVVSDTEITCTTPAGSNGARNVVVTNADTGTVTSTGGFTYVSAPTISSVAPSAGLATGGTVITITGTQFAAGATVTVGGVACPILLMVPSTEIMCTTPAGSVGAADVVVTNTDTGTVTSAGAFTYSESVPTIGSVSPSSGSNAGGTPITITGTQFGPGATVTVGGAACTSVTVVSLTTITCTTPAGSDGAVDVVVTNTDTGTVTSTGGFTYVSSPTVASIAPDRGNNSGGTPITITGTQFAAGATVTVGGAACTSLTVVSDTEITCTTPAGSVGAANVVVTNADTGAVTSAGGFTYVGTPTIGSIAPAAGNSSGGTVITITGTQFAAGATVTVGGAACPILLLVPSTEIMCTTPAGSVGSADVVVTNTDTGTVTSAGGFTYVTAPTIASMSPSSGPVWGNNTITITGTGFAAGATVTVGGNACTGLTVVSATEITCTAPAGNLGAANVVLTNTNGGTVTSAGGYTYSQSAPTIGSLSPAGGNNTGGTVITITGTQFGPGATVTVGGAACTSITVVSATEITCTTPPGSNGAADVVVTNVDSGTVTDSGGFTYVTPPGADGLSPASGATTGGTLITITGSGFAAGATVKIGGQSCTNVTVVSATQITCITPAGLTGTVNIEVSNPNLGTVTLVGAFTYTGASPAATKEPNALRKVKVIGGPRAKRFLVRWTAPAGATAPESQVGFYRLTVQQGAYKKFIINKRLGKNAVQYKITRAQLLKGTQASRGDMRGLFRYIVKIRAVNTVGEGPVTRRSIILAR